MRSEYIFHILSFVAITVALFLVPWWTVDDAYISYRYGRTFAETGQLIWNPGGEAVEGYTGVLLPLISALLLKVGLPLVSTIKILGVGAAIGTGFLIRLTLIRLEVDKRLAGIGSLYFFLVPLLYVHALSGLETTIFTFFSYLYIFSLLPSSLKRSSFPSIPLLSLLGILLFLCRPEGVVWALLPLGIRFLIPAEDGKYQVKVKLVIIGLIVLSAMALYGFWKWHFYGSVLPNTYFAKEYLEGMNVASLKEGLKFAFYYLALPGAAAIFLMAFSTVPKLKLNRNGLFVCLSIGGLFLLTMISYARSQLFMNYAFRFFFPFLPGGILLIGLFLKSWPKVRGKNALGPKIGLALASLLLLGQLALLIQRGRVDITFLKDYMALMEQEWKPAAEFLNTTLPPGSKVILYQDAGIIAFNGDFDYVDFGRLSDAYLAREKPSPSQAADYFFQQGADAVVFTSLEADRYEYYEEGEFIQADRRFQQYELARKFGNDRGYPYYQWVYLRK